MPLTIRRTGRNFRVISRVVRPVSIGERTGIRPSVWVLCAALVGVSGFVVYLALEEDPLGLVQAREDEAREGAQGRSSRDGRRQRALASASSGGPRSGSGYARHDWNVESDLSRRMALGLPMPGFWREPQQSTLDQDPQLAAMYRSFNDQRDVDSDAPPLPFQPTAHRAELLSAEGEMTMRPQSCDVRVLPVQMSQFNCLVRVTCDGAILYPHAGQDAGYVPCDVENGVPVRALDDMYSGNDGDPLVDLDLAAGTITVEDVGPDGQRRYRATLRINS
jgi:hypothetical protein